MHLRGGPIALGTVATRSNLPLASLRWLPPQAGTGSNTGVRLAPRRTSDV